VGSLNKNTENSRTVSETGSRRVQKKPQKSSKEETTKRKIKKQEKKSAAEEGKEAYTLISFRNAWVYST
jgi:hypothetical protein